MHTKKILFIVNMSWEELTEKGVSEMVLERDEGGYFDHVYSAHFPAYSGRAIKLNERHTIVEIKGKTRNRALGRLGVSHLLSVCRMPVAVWKLARLVRKEDIDIIRSIDPFHTALIGYFVSRITRRPWCVSIHADHDIRFRLNNRKGLTLHLLRWLRDFSLKRADMVMPIRRSLAEKAISQGAIASRIRVIPHGIDFSIFKTSVPGSLLKELGIAGKKTIVFAGRLRRENYIFDILDIAKKSVAREPDARFLIVGGGKDQDDFRRQVEADGMGRYFVFPGFLPREKVIALRKAADVNLCLMGGFSLLEAAASGRPIVAYDVEWHHEVIKDSDTGILVKEHDTTAAAEAVLGLLRDPSAGARLGERARDLVFRYYSLENASRAKIACYEELLKRHKDLVSSRRQKWHTEDQILTYRSPHLRRLFEERVKYISKTIEDYAEKRKPQITRVLDAGCGDGALLVKLAVSPNVHLSGLDFNPLRVERAKNNVPGAEIKCGNLTDLKLEKGGFDIVLLNHVLEHINDDEAVLKNLRAALADGGLFLLGLPNEGCLLGKMRNNLIQPHLKASTDHVNFYTRLSIEKKLKETGFRIRTVRSESFFFPHYSVWSLLMSTAIGYRLLELLGKLFPSQASGFCFVCEKAR